DVHRVRVLDAERIAKRTGDEEPAACDGEDDVGLEAVAVNPLREGARSLAERVPGHHLALVAHSLPSSFRRRHRTMPSVTPAIRSPRASAIQPHGVSSSSDGSAAVVSASVGAATPVSVGTDSVTVSTSVAVAVSVSVFTTVV